MAPSCHHPLSQDNQWSSSSSSSSSSSPLPPHHRSLQGLCDSICGRASRDKSNFFSISIHDRVFWIEIQSYFWMFCSFEMLIFFFKSASYPPGICPLTDVASFTESQVHRIRIPDPCCLKKKNPDPSYCCFLVSNPHALSSSSCSSWLSSTSS